MINAKRILGSKAPETNTSKKETEYESSNEIKVAVMFILIALALIIQFSYSISQGTKWYIDQLVALGFLLILYLDRKHLKLNSLAITLLGIALFLPNGGTFGWYGLSYGAFHFDNLIHFAGFFAAGVILLNYLRENIQSLPKLLLIILLASTGAGAFIEIAEFAGYTFLGPGEGMLFFGIGDGAVVDGQCTPSAWINNMTDLVFNVLGSAVGIILAMSYNWYLEREVG